MTDGRWHTGRLPPTYHTPRTTCLFLNPPYDSGRSMGRHLVGWRVVAAVCFVVIEEVTDATPCASMTHEGWLRGLEPPTPILTV